MAPDELAPSGASACFPDVAVIGAGPVGCVTALAFARKGARVLLLDARAPGPRRLAGEWVHPLGVRALKSLGIVPDDFSASAGRGFAIFPGPVAAPLLLPYPEDRPGLACEHHVLV